MKQLLIALSIGLLLGAALLYFAWARPELEKARNQEPIRDTVWETKMVEIPVPVPVEVRTVDTLYREVFIPGPTDTLRVIDTLPRQQLVYADSLYRAVVSGIEPSLDSLTLYQTTRTIYVEKVVPEPRKLWALDIMAGAGLDAQGLSKYAGMEVKFKPLKRIEFSAGAGGSFAGEKASPFVMVKASVDILQW